MEQIRVKRFHRGKARSIATASISSRSTTGGFRSSISGAAEFESNLPFVRTYPRDHGNSKT